jgi:hypothetical protein
MIDLLFFAEFQAISKVNVFVLTISSLSKGHGYQGER